MNDEERVRLLSLYGSCRVCGEPRRAHTFHETDAQGQEHYWTRLLCTSDPLHGQDLKDGAVIEGKHHPRKQTAPDGVTEYDITGREARDA